MQVCELYRIGFPNGKFYVGISSDAKERFESHLANARRGMKLPVYSAIRKYGAESLVLEVLAKGERSYIAEMEIRAIEVFNTRDSSVGYNVAKGGETSPVAGIGHSDASKAKMSASQKKRVRTPDEILKMSRSLKGRVMTPEHRARLSETAKRRWDEKEEKRLPRTLDRLEAVQKMLDNGMKRSEIAKELNLSKARTRLLVLEATREE